MYMLVGPWMPIPCASYEINCRNCHYHKQLSNLIKTCMDVNVVKAY